MRDRKDWGSQRDVAGWPGKPWVPPTQLEPPPAPPATGPKRVQVGFDQATLEQLQKLQGMFQNLEPEIRKLVCSVERLERELNEMKEMIRESGRPAADPGSGSQPQGPAGA